MTDELPPGWALVTVGDVAHFIRGVTYSKEHARYSDATGFVPVLRATNIGDGLDYNDMVFVPDRFVSDEQIVKDGDVVLAMSSGSKSVVGKAAIAKSPPRCAFGAFCGVVRPSDAIDHSLLGYYFQTKAYRNAVSDVSKGSNINNLKAEHVLCRPLPIPPKTEQARIVSKLNELFSRIDEGERALERVQKLVERYRQSVLKAAVTGELTRDWREKNKDQLESGEALLARILKARREAWEKAELDKMKAKGITPVNDKWKLKYEEPSPPDTAELPELPDGWVWTTLDHLTRELDQGWSPQCESVPASSDGKEWGVIKTTAIQAMRYEGDANKALPASLEPRPDLEVQPGDILVTRAGPRTRVGISCLVRATRSQLMICDKVYRLRVFKALVLNEYVEIALNSPLLLRELEKLKSGISDSGLNLKQERFLALVVPLPPLGEQLRVVDAVAEALSEGENAAIHSKVRSDSLRQAILKLAFCGQLVGQQPDDESASALLELIPAERNEAPAKPKRGRKSKNQEPA